MKRLLVLIPFLFAGCVEQTTQENSQAITKSPDSQAPRGSIVLTGDFVAKEGILLNADAKTLFTENVNSGYTFSLQNKPSFLSVDGNTGILSGTPTSSGTLINNITIVATKNSDGSKLEKLFSIAVNGDPLRTHSWHLNNTGQTSFAATGGNANIDVNVDDVYKSGITGAGVRIAVSDSGVQITHDDLHENGLSGEHRDYSLNAPYLGNPVTTSAHGTAVTGIISAMGWNNRGSLGIAPGSKFAGFQFLDSPQSSSILIHQASGGFNIFNYSYGDTILGDRLSDSTYMDHLRHETLNNGKIYVKAAGNEFLLGEGSVCGPHNANFPYENESPFIIVAGAVNAEGGKAQYSNAGSNIWVSAPGGEYGSSEPAIITTDLKTCLSGYSRAKAYIYNNFEYGHSLNTTCDYTSVMNGTSSAAPAVSGVIALMLEKNSNLKMRDVKHILASTSKRIDPNHLAGLNWVGKDHPSNRVGGCSSQNLAGHTYEQGWVQNAAGIWFNNFYGFGLVDANAAVTMADGYVSALGTQVELNPNFQNGTFGNSGISGSIPDNSAAGYTNVINVPNALTVESVQVKVNVTHPRSGQLGVELTSPSGTKSILMNINNSFSIENDSNLNIVLTSNAFYNESSAGNWIIKLIDGKSGHTGTLNSWQINVLGH